MRQRYCQRCHQKYIAGGGRQRTKFKQLEAEDREKRIQRMIERAEKRLPLFDS